MSLPEWLKVKQVGLHKTKSFLRSHKLHTVCEEARCPNQAVCFSKPVATFMILGNRCTRNCAFCAVPYGIPEPPDSEEPQRIAQAVNRMGLKYVVITSVTRDDLLDGGASQFAKCVALVRENTAAIKVETLIPDFKGKTESLKILLKAQPDVLNHNMETVHRLYPLVRPQADYLRSLNILKLAKDMFPDITTKSGLMLGLGETKEEVLMLMSDLRNANCDMLTIGQYMRPSRKNLPVYEYINPEVFEDYKIAALERGFRFVASAPLVRSSMNAEEMFYGL